MELGLQFMGLHLACDEADEGKPGAVPTAAAAPAEERSRPLASETRGLCHFLRRNSIKVLAVLSRPLSW